MPPSSSSSQQQQQAASNTAANAATTTNNTNTTTNTINNASTTATTATMPPRPLSQKEQEQTRPPSALLRTLPPMTSPPPPPPPAGAPTPLSLLQHPSLLPLRVQTGADGRRSVVLPDGTPLIDGLSADMPAAESLPGPLAGAQAGRPLVLGLRSPTSSARATTDAVVGALRCQRFLSCARNKLWWMTPEWGTEAAQLPGETQFLLVELAEGGPYGLLLPLISDDTFRATLRPARGSGGGGVLGGLLGGLGNSTNR